MEQVSNIKGETEKRLDLLKELEDSQSATLDRRKSFESELAARY